MILKTFVSLLCLFAIQHSAHADTLCGRVAVNRDGQYSLVRDIANLGTSGGYPIRKVYQVEDASPRQLKALRDNLDSFVCLAGFRHGERPFTFVPVDAPAADQ